MAPRALIVGLSGTRLSEDERAYLRAARPWGVIVFRRNVADEAQLAALTGEVRDALGRADAPILVDQEGGRVQRLGPPVWPTYPPARAIGEIHARDRELGLEAAGLSGRLIAGDLRRVGLTVACLPVLDVDLPGADPIIGDRSYGADPGDVAEIARAVGDGVLASGCLPVIKHIPGHGRATCDSHLELPRVSASLADLRAIDFAPFAKLRDYPLGMTAHVLYEAIDSERPATLSPRIIDEMIRGEIGFDGLLMSDDLSMGALSGPVAARGAAAIEAGCDIALHCNGDMDEMRGLAESVPELTGRALKRAESALARIAGPHDADLANARRRFADLMAAPEAGVGA